jgi:hypothetical protein
MLRAETPQEQFNLIGAGRRNFTINGDMKVWQRGTSFTTTNSSYYFADRWTMGSNISNLTVSRNTGVAVGPFPKKNTLRMEATGASGFDLYQLYEEWEALSNQTITISFWYKTNVKGVIIRQWSTASYDTVPMSEDWSYFTTTFTLGTLVAGARAANTASFGLWANGGLVSGDYFEFTNYQLELGKVATPFEHRSYGEELALCKRYFQNIYNGQCFGSANTTTRMRINAPLSPTMRANPTVARVAGTISFQGMGIGFTSTSTAVAQSSPSGPDFLGFDLAGFTSLTGRAYAGSQSRTLVFTASAEL